MPHESAEEGGSVQTMRHLLWIPAGALVGGLTSFVFGDTLSLPVDLYYLIYFGVSLGFLGLYARWTDLEIRPWAKRRLAAALILGIVGGLVLMRGALARPGTPGPSGVILAWAVLYRGLLYGTVDGLLLFTFPWLVAWRAFGSEGATRGVRMRASAVALAGMLLVTTAYHLGYRDFRSSRITMPNVGAVISGIPTLASANPVASPIAHVILHVTAVFHSPGSDLYLPPHRQSRP